MRGGLYNPRPVDDTPVNGQLAHGVTSNWAYDHAADYGLHKLVTYKTANQIVNNSTVLVNDTHLFIPIAANEIWKVVFFLYGITAAAADWKTNVTAPGGAAGSYMTEGIGINIYTDVLGASRGWAGQAFNELFRLSAIVINGATPGNVQCQWAQNIADVSDTTMLIGSCAVATQLA